MNILLAFLLYRNLTASEIRRLGPFLPVQTRRGLNAMLAYDSSDLKCDSDDDPQDQNSFPFLLLKLIGMQQPSQSDLFALLKAMLPKEMAANLPDPETLMNMMSILSAMDLSDTFGMRSEHETSFESSPSESEQCESEQCESEQCESEQCESKQCNSEQLRIEPSKSDVQNFSREQVDFFQSFLRK